MGQFLLGTLFVVATVYYFQAAYRKYAQQKRDRLEKDYNTYIFIKKDD